MSPSDKDVAELKRQFKKLSATLFALKVTVILLDLAILE